MPRHWEAIQSCLSESDFSNVVPPSGQAHILRPVLMQTCVERVPFTTFKLLKGLCSTIGK